MELPGEKLVMRMWETLAEKGVGLLLKPWQDKREGKANLELRRAEMLVLAQAERDAEQIRSGEKRVDNFTIAEPFAALALTRDKLADRIEPIINLPVVLNYVARQSVEDAVRRQINLAKTIVQAEESLVEETQPPPEEKIDGDWLYRWRDFASEVSSEEMQQLWGRLLAGEIKAPGTYSLRCLDFLRCLSQEEAKSIARFSRFAIEDRVITDVHRGGFDLGPGKLLDAMGVTLALLRELQDLGVVSGVDLGGFVGTYSSIEKGKFVIVLKSFGKALIVRHDDEAKSLKLQSYPFTTLGKQILGLGRFEAPFDYLVSLGKELLKDGFDVELADFIKKDEQTITTSNEVRITEDSVVEKET